MRLPRILAAPLDGMVLALDLDLGTYCAVPVGDRPVTPSALAAALEVTTDSVGLAGDALKRLEHARRDLQSFGQAAPHPNVGARDWLDLILSIPPALIALRFRSPRGWFDATATSGTPESSVSAARRFQRMRPFIPWLSRCLPHALLLRAYLRRTGCPSTLVIGVRIFPFEAHSWVQAGDTVLNDDVERVAAYTVIAAG
jgi:hypothetical protein